jgi:hypothetical protein
MQRQSGLAGEQQAERVFPSCYRDVILGAIFLEIRLLLRAFTVLLANRSGRFQRIIQ